MQVSFVSLRSLPRTTTEPMEPMEDATEQASKRTTIQDVASRAGVAPSTVSYVLSGKRSISEETRQRVLQTIEEMNFTVSSLGRRMRQGRTQSIGVASPALSANDWSLPEFFGSIATAAGEHHYTTGFFVDRTPEQLVDLNRSRFVDGFLLIEITHTDPRVEALRNADIPFVMLGRTHDSTGLTYVDFEFEQTLQVALEHLVSLGHRKVAYQKLPPRTTSDIYNGFLILDSLRRARGAYPLELIELEVPFRHKQGLTATLQLLDHHPDITAMITHNHIETLHALHKRHVRVPEECSIIGITTAAQQRGCAHRLDDSARGRSAHRQNPGKQRPRKRCHARRPGGKTQHRTALQSLKCTLHESVLTGFSFYRMFLAWLRPSRNAAVPV
jgi:DNA-binding LacI/PurR family transcriptional regulator